MRMFVSSEPRKQSLPIDVTLSGSVTSVMSEKAKALSETVVQPLFTLTERTFLLFVKAPLMTFTDAGSVSSPPFPV